MDNKALIRGRPTVSALAYATRAFARTALLSALMTLGGCLGFGGPGNDQTPDAIVTQQPLPISTSAQEIVVGTGSVTVAMLLPLSAGGSASGLAQSFRNAAELALGEAQGNAVRIVIRDDAGDTDAARAAAEAAIAGGAQLILGPVFAPAVSGAADVARTAEVPVVAFSTDATLAGRGVYLLSFLPRQDASRIVAYAAETGIRSFAGLVPDNGYGLVMEAAFREAVSAADGRVVGVERYAAGGIGDAARKLKERGAFDAMFVPNGGDDPGSAAAALSDAGIRPRLLGSGQWDNPQVLASPALVGAWYPAPAPGGFQNFAQRYQARYGATPPRTAALVYDAALLANGLVSARGTQAFRSQSIEAPDGFLGVDGIFRLAPSGLSERGLAVFEVSTGGAATVVAPAPTKFFRGF